MFAIESPAPKESFDGSTSISKMSTKSVDTDQYLWFSTKYQLRPPIGSNVYQEVSFLWHYMIKQVTLYTTSNFSRHPPTHLENIDILSL